MDAANLTAAWVSAVVTAIGLGSLVTQAAAIRNQLDPFHDIRGSDYLGVWTTSQRLRRWYELNREAPVGPLIEANLHGCLDESRIYLSRNPLYVTGIATWTRLLAVFHPMKVWLDGRHPLSVAVHDDKDSVSAAPHPGAIVAHSPLVLPESNASIQTRWLERLESKALVYHRGKAGTTISRTTLITILLLSQARVIYHYAAASGLRMAYVGYNGFYQIEWPIGERATLIFEAHESHARGTDRLPETFSRRPQKCVEMCVGVINATVSTGSIIAFAGRKPFGRCKLELLPRRFGSQRSSADLYNKIGGYAHEVDYLCRIPLEPEDPEPRHARRIEVRAPTGSQCSTLYLEAQEVEIIAACLDHLPWSSIPWSIHRGMKDVLLGYGKKTLAKYRTRLAGALQDAVKTNAWALAAQGWEPTFVADCMADQAASAIIGGDSCSGDGCRIVSAAALFLCPRTDDASLDQTSFWRDQLRASGPGVEDAAPQKLSADTVVALVKLLFVLWSHEFDYEIYHHLPSELIVL